VDRLTLIGHPTVNIPDVANCYMFSQLFQIFAAIRVTSNQPNVDHAMESDAIS
jgi:hypothetical protein